MPEGSWEPGIVSWELITEDLAANSTAPALAPTPATALRGGAAQAPAHRVPPHSGEGSACRAEVPGAAAPVCEVVAAVRTWQGRAHELGAGQPSGLDLSPECAGQPLGTGTFHDARVRDRACVALWVLAGSWQAGRRLLVLQAVSVGARGYFWSCAGHRRCGAPRLSLARSRAGAESLVPLQDTQPPLQRAPL